MNLMYDSGKDDQRYDCVGANFDTGNWICESGELGLELWQFLVEFHLIETYLIKELVKKRRIKLRSYLIEAKDRRVKPMI